MGIVELIIVGRWGRLGVKNGAKYSAASTGQGCSELWLGKAEKNPRPQKCAVETS